MWKIVGAWEAVKLNEVEMTKKLWEKTFEEPYEKAGCEAVSGVQKIKPPIYWKVTDLDVNTKYKSLLPRFLSEVSCLYCISLPMYFFLQFLSRDRKEICSIQIYLYFPFDVVGII